MNATLDVFLLDTVGAQGAPGVIAVGRRGDDTAIESIALNPDVQNFLAFRDRVEQALLEKATKPTGAELRQFGVDLFNWLFRGSLRALYARVPQGSVTLQILSNRGEVMALPWEFIQPPDRNPVPHRERSVVRVLETCGIDSLRAKGLKKIRVLFAVADPVDQPGVAWEDVQAVMQKAFDAQLPGGVEFTIVEGATRNGLVKLITKENFDFFHFFGHGHLSQGQSGLVLTDVKAHKSDFMPALQVAQLLSGKGTRLVLLSDCLTGAGNFADDFSVVATALIRAGVPSVVANQTSIPIKAIAPFVGAVYASLLREGNIDIAVMEGRVALALMLSNTTGNDAIVEWGIPTLYRLAGSSQIFK